jgi:dimethylargininase
VGRELLVGLSSRTDAAGIAALAAIAGRFGYAVTTVPVRGSLHLKTACCALPDGRLLVNASWIDVAPLRADQLVHVPEEEPWGANIALAGAGVLMGSAHARTAALVRSLGFAVRTVDLGELARAEGGITCLALFIA